MRLEFSMQGLDCGDYILHLPHIAFLSDEPEFKISRHSHDYHEIHFIHSGTAYNVTNRREMLLQPGIIYFVKAGDEHEQYNLHKEQPVQKTSLGFQIDPKDGKSMDCFNISSLHSGHYKYTTDYLLINHLCMKLIDEFMNEHMGYKENVKSIAIQLIVHMLRLFQQGGAGSTVEDPFFMTMEDVMHWIEGNLEGNLKAEQLARYCSLSPSHFRRSFQKFSGESVGQYILKRKMERAVQLLYAGFSVRETASRLGFLSPYHFSRQFKKMRGCSPKYIDMGVGELL